VTVPYEVDPDLIAYAMSINAPPRTPAARGDWRTLREQAETGLSAIDSSLPEHPEIARADHTAEASDGAALLVRWYEPRPGAEGTPGPAVVFLHGGGMILGSVAMYDRLVAGYVAASGVPFLSVDYRLAPEHPHPTPVEDCFTGLQWLVAHAQELGIDPDRIGVMGDSAGGGLAAGTVLLARDRSVPVARQILVYPMLDDRTTTPDPELAPYAAWSYDDNYTGWHALLGDAVGGPDVPYSAAPARADDVSGLPPTFIDTGELDIFRDECIDYARRISATGTSVELHVHPGCPHGFDRMPIPVAERAFADRVRVLQRL
jgi:acetyl esterase/lipase